jgi:hypothetical protein
MPYIHETIIVTQTPEGEPHIAPLGLIQDGEEWIAAPFKPSCTLDNLRAHPFFTASVTDDVRVFAGCLTGRKLWPTMPAQRIAGRYLASAHTHYEFHALRLTDDELRPKWHCRAVHAKTHRPAPGFNRAQAAVIELAILTSRLHMLPEDKIHREIEYLQIAIKKTAGPREEEAWGWLMARVEAHLAAS